MTGFAGGMFVITFEERGPPDNGWSGAKYTGPVYWLGIYTSRMVGIPLWAVFLVAVIPSSIGWRRYRRPPPGRCQKCGYDLTGNVTGVCPECGTEIL